MKRSLQPDESENHREKRRAFDDRALSRPTDKWMVHPFNKFNGPFPHFRQPVEIGNFSHDETRQFVHDCSQLKYFSPPVNVQNAEIDLTAGYRNFIKKDDSKSEYIDDLLKWVLLNRHKFRIEGQPAISDKLNTDFVCWRGLLTKLVCTPYENRTGWKLAVIRHQGTYFLCAFDTEVDVLARQQQNARQKEMCYWGWKFEQYVTADRPGGVPNFEVPVNNHADFASVVRARLGSHSLVFAGEVDCCEDSMGKKKYIELKTSRVMYSMNQEKTFKRFKLIKWWAQSFLLDVPKIACGFRDDDGVVLQMKCYNTQEIPKIVKDEPDSWDPAKCFNFCDEFLQLVKDTVTEDNIGKPYVFFWNPHEPVRWYQSDGEVASEYSFLPQWFHNQQQS